MTSSHHPPPAVEIHDEESRLIERWTRAAVDLLVPASIMTDASSSSTTTTSSSTREDKMTKKRRTNSSSSSSSTFNEDLIEQQQEDLQLKWLVVIFTISLFLVFQILCLASSLTSSSSFSSSSSSTTSSSFFFLASSSSSPTTSSTSVWIVAACTMSMAVELGLVWLLYATRDLTLVASSLAGVTNLFVLGLALFSSASSSPSLSSGDLLVWLLYGPLLVFLVCGERRGFYAMAAVVLQSVVLSSTHDNINSTSGSGVVRAASNVAAVMCVGALAYAGQRTRAHTERRLRAALAQCAESRDDLRNASETKQKFLANMSHELRTPLHGITATALELLETLSPADKAARECCQLIAECGRLMRSLIEDILDFEQIESNRLMLDKLPFDVVHEVERAVRVLAGAAAKKSIDIDVSTAVSYPLHVGDPLRFRQIVFNLLSNAIKFTPDGGRIRVSANGSDAKPEEVNVEVTDNGIGIGADHLPYLFVGFSQEDNSARRRNGGTGLGLAISKSLCEAMGGSIGCRSKPGQGSTFHFTVELPVAVPTAAEAPTTPSIPTNSATTSADSSAAVDAVQPTIQQEPSSTPSPPVSAPNSPSLNPASMSSRTQTAGGFRPLSCSSTFIPSPLTVAPSSKSPVIESSFNGVRVLLVEDNLVNQKVGVRMLASLGCSVQVAVNGEECLRILDAAEAHGRDNDDGHHDDGESKDSNHSEYDRGFDAVLMDCQMPVMDGFQATSLIREREQKHTPARRPLPVIALTASATKEYREQCFLSGMNDWLAKPFTKANLAHMLRKWARPDLAGAADQDGNVSSNIPSNSTAPADICT